MFSLDIFGFRANWSPFFLLALLLILGGYFLLVQKYYSRFEDGRKASISEMTLFSSGIILLYLVKGSPLDLLGHITFYAHMTQMAFLYLVIPPLLITGLPEWVWRFLLGRKGMKAAFAFITKPLIALVLFNGFFSVYHIPLIFDVVKTDMWLHAAYTSMLFVFAIAMWWPLVNRLSEHQTLSGLKKVGYIFADGILLTPACALIIFADTSLYATFSDPDAWAKALELCVPASMLAGLSLSGPEMFSSMSLVEDQQLGGVLMKIIQEIVYGVVLAYSFFSWYKKEQTNEPDLSIYQQPEPAE